MPTVSTSQSYQGQLRDHITTVLSLDDIRLLCSDMALNYEDLQGETLQTRANSLVLWASKNKQLPFLISLLEIKYPFTKWPHKTTITASDCPYKGLFAFQEEDVDIFFGREKDTERLLKAITKRSIVAVVGASGSGKSSLVFGGLVPEIRKHFDWLIIKFRPKQDPLMELARALTPFLYDDEIELLSNTRKLRDEMDKNKQLLVDIIDRILRINDASRLLIIADQFEELYTLCQTVTIRRKFLDLLLSQFSPYFSQNNLNSPLLVITLRADFMGQVLKYRPFADALKGNVELLGPMTSKELKYAIEQPVENNGIEFESGLVERILNDVNNEPGALPLLEFALEKLWGMQQNFTLTHVAYEQIGQVKGAITTYADEVIDQKLTVEEQELVKHIFIQLVQPGEDTGHTGDTRRLATREDIGEPSWEMIRNLADWRLLVTNQSSETNQETVEVVHEALIHHWERLRKWLASDRDFRIWQEWLRKMILEWERIDHDESALLRGASLRKAEAWLEQRPNSLAKNEVTFIEKSAHYYENRSFYQWYDEFKSDFSIWISSDRAHDWLLKGNKLDVAESWFATHKTLLLDENKKFIIASSTVRNEKQLAKTKRFRLTYTLVAFSSLSIILAIMLIISLRLEQGTDLKSIDISNATLPSNISITENANETIKIRLTATAASDQFKIASTVAAMQLSTSIALISPTPNSISVTSTAVANFVAEELSKYSANQSQKKREENATLALLLAIEAVKFADTSEAIDTLCISLQNDESQLQCVIDKNALIDMGCSQANRNISIAEWEQIFPQIPYRKTCNYLP